MRRLAASFALMLTLGCGGKLYEVHEGTTKVNGVPFYTMASSCTQESVYIETIYQLSVQVPRTQDTPAIVLMEKSVPASVYTSPAMQQLRQVVAAPTLSLSAIKTQFDPLAAYNPDADPELVPISNTTRAEVYVDYARVHYLNVERPGRGTTSATAKLNANGTLAESSAEVEDKTAETILGAFPVSEAVLGILSKAGLPGILVEGIDEKAPIAFQLVVTPNQFRHVFTKTEKANPPCPPAKDGLTRKDAANWRREAVSDSAKGEKEENAIGVTGKIVLPKKSGGL